MAKCYFMGIEDISYHLESDPTAVPAFNANNAGATDLTGAYWNAFSRGALSILTSAPSPTAVGDLTDPDTHAAAVLTEGWAGARVTQYSSGGPGVFSNYAWFILRAPDGTYLWGLRNDPTTTFLSLYRFSGSTRDATAGANVANAGFNLDTNGVANHKKIDINFKYDASGFIRVYVNGALAIEYVGNTLVDAAAGVGSIMFRNPGTGVYSQLRVSEGMVCDVDTRFMHVKTNAISAAGDVNTMAAGTYADIDEATLSDADTVQTTAAGQEIAASCTGLPADGTGGLTQANWIKAGVQVQARISAGVSGPQSVLLGVKSAGVVSDGAAQAATTSYATYRQAFGAINPSTGLPWTVSDLNALQAHIKSGT